MGCSMPGTKGNLTRADQEKKLANTGQGLNVWKHFQILIEQSVSKLCSHLHPEGSLHFGPTHIKALFGCCFRCFLRNMNWHSHRFTAPTFQGLNKTQPPVLVGEATSLFILKTPLTILYHDGGYSRYSICHDLVSALFQEVSNQFSKGITCGIHQQAHLEVGRTTGIMFG